MLENNQYFRFILDLQFLFDPINYDELRHVYSSDEIAELYRPFRRYTEHCPAVLAEWRKRQRKGGKHHRNRYGDYGLFRSQSWNLDPYCNGLWFRGMSRSHL